MFANKATNIQENKTKHIQPIKDIDTANVCQYIEVRVDTHPFFKTYKNSKTNKNPRPKSLLNLKTPFKWVSMDIITASLSNILTKYTIFYNYLLFCGFILQTTNTLLNGKDYY